MTGPATRRKGWGAIVGVAALLGAGPTAWAAQTDTTSAIPPSRSARPLEYQIGDAITLFGEIAFRLEYFSNEFFAENDATVDDDHRFRERVRLRPSSPRSGSRETTSPFMATTHRSAISGRPWQAS